MDDPSLQPFSIAIFTLVAIGAAGAQSRIPEVPLPHNTAPESRAVTTNDKAVAPVAGAGTLGAARAIPFDQMTVRTLANGGESREIAHGALATGELVNLHQSMQVVGQTPSALHGIRHSEFILVREGEIEFQHEVAGHVVAEKVGPGGVLYVPFGTRHALRNIGTVPARYFVVAIGGDAK